MENKKISMYQGENKSIIFTVTQKDGSPKILDNGNAKFVITNGNSIIIQKILGNGVLISGNKITVLLDASDTIGLYGNYSFELRAVDEQENSNVVSIGMIEIKKSFTV